MTWFFEKQLVNSTILKQMPVDVFKRVSHPCFSKLTRGGPEQPYSPPGYLLATVPRPSAGPAPPLYRPTTPLSWPRPAPQPALSRPSAWPRPAAWTRPAASPARADYLG